MAIVAPSILSADFSCLGEEIASISQAEWIHVDVMDGRFVPNITIGPLVVKALRPLTEKFIDCHLMIVEPDNYVQDFRNAGADLISVHAEAVDHLDRSVQVIKQTGAQAGVALNPHTPDSVLDYVLEELDLVLVMSVNPGFGGQSLIERVFPKIERIRKRIDAPRRTMPIALRQPELTSWSADRVFSVPRIVKRPYTLYSRPERGRIGSVMGAECLVMIAFDTGNIGSVLEDSYG